ncbi:Polyadenylate-binding protein-interacting protein 2 [Apostasia shenzhenica]|uniref:Polyadenylate-binding protein-interacting protein 2 n=1 Tax=Apostasia shenzhenica TaxID=1088818 RepID=A0A2I0BHG8_9ASPA|nr:Polyadenylate-binding protein-interacting protein 2 [Apostasia shenzhenica]
MASTLNPYAAPFFPQAYLAVDDFSPEWWQLVKSSPWFRDFWLRERFDEEDELQALDIDRLFHSYSPAQLLLIRRLSVPVPTVISEDDHVGKKIEEKNKMELMTWGADKWMATRGVWREGLRFSEKAPKIVSLRVSPRTIQQPR